MCLENAELSTTTEEMEMWKVVVVGMVNGKYRNLFRVERNPTTEYKDGENVAVNKGTYPNCSFGVAWGFHGFPHKHDAESFKRNLKRDSGFICLELAVIRVRIPVGTRIATGVYEGLGSSNPDESACKSLPSISAEKIILEQPKRT